MRLDLSFSHFCKILKVPIKFVLKTLDGSFLDASIAGSTQQSIIKLNLGSNLIFFEFSMFKLKL